MPRAARPTKPPHRPSSAKSNAAGYAKRKAQPPRAARASAADVYEYQPERVRRATVQLQLEKDELRGAGRGGESDGEGSEAGVGRAKPRLVGEDDEDGIAEEEDEELDSDAAFEESDEERYAGFSFASSKVCFRLVRVYVTGCPCRSPSPRRSPRQSPHSQRPSALPKSI